MSGMSSNTSTSLWRRDWGLHEPLRIEFTPEQKTSESAINPDKFTLQGSRSQVQDTRFEKWEARLLATSAWRLITAACQLTTSNFLLEKFILRTDCDRAKILSWRLILPTGLNRMAIILVSPMIIQAIGPRVPIWRILRDISKTFSGEVIPGFRKVAELDIAWSD